MSSPVSPRQRDIGGSGELASRRVDRQPQSGFSARLAKLQRCFLPNPSACGTSPIRALRTAEEDIATYPNRAQPHICQHHQPLNHKLSTLNLQLSTLNSKPCNKKKSPASLPCFCSAGIAAGSVLRRSKIYLTTFTTVLSLNFRIYMPFARPAAGIVVSPSIAAAATFVLQCCKLPLRKQHRLLP